MNTRFRFADSFHSTVPSKNVVKPDKQDPTELLFGEKLHENVLF
jgi:hypothetical protein